MRREIRAASPAFGYDLVRGDLTALRLSADFSMATLDCPANDLVATSLVLGADPALMLAGIFPLPEGIEEIVFSGLIRGKRTRMTRAKTLGLDVPADAVSVLEDHHAVACQQCTVG